MTISLNSPNTDNYVVGKGKVYFMPEGASGTILDHHVGNVTEFEIEPAIERLDHFSQMEGVRSKDKSIILEKGLTVRMIMEEWTPSNLRLYLLGEPDDADDANVTIDIFADNSLRGHLRYVGENEIGPKWSFDLPVVEFTPEGALNMISDEWAPIEVSGDILFEDGTFGTASADFSAGSAPAMLTGAAISGTAQVGQTLTAYNGTWSGHPSHYTYQWQVDDGGGYDPVAVGGTGKTYVPVVGEVGNPLRVIVTAHNATGTASSTSNPTPDVIAA